MRAGLCVVLLLLGGDGCAYSTPTPLVPASLPAFGAVDVEASEVTVEDPGKDLSPESARDARKVLCDLLAGARHESGDSGPPARLRARVVGTADSTGSGGSGGGDGGIVLVAVAVFVAIPFGLTFWHEQRALDVTVEAGGKRFEGHGSGDAWGSIYASAERRALALALQNALLDAANHPLVLAGAAR